MQRRYLPSLSFLAAFAILTLARPILAQGRSDEPLILEPPRDDVSDSEAINSDEVEPMLRGPLHEAFAQPTESDADPSLVVPKAPPEPVEELPPEIKPEGEDVEWIPGYWAWDEELEDFLWVSGVWRSVPPDRRWIPGYWDETDQGQRRVAGFWAPIEAEQVEYLPEPPESLEIGPTTASPGGDYYWVDGCWIYRTSRYAWRPGYWARYSPGWVWIASHYRWTPLGCVYVSGYWDYALADRGQLFAPVYFHSPVYTQPGYRFSPSVCVNASNVFLHLFVNPGRRCYYWGNYYGNRYRNAGFYPWHDYSRRVHLDSLFTYYDVRHRRRNVDFQGRMRQWHDYFAADENRRPPRRWDEHSRFAQRIDRNSSARFAVLGDSLEQLVRGAGNQNRYRRLTDNQRKQVAQSSDWSEISRRRMSIETSSDSATSSPPGNRPAIEGRRGLPRLSLPEIASDRVRRFTNRPPSKRPESPRTTSERRGNSDTIGNIENQVRRAFRRDLGGADQEKDSNVDSARPRNESGNAIERLLRERARSAQDGVTLGGRNRGSQGGNFSNRTERRSSGLQGQLERLGRQAGQPAQQGALRESSREAIRESIERFRQPSRSSSGESGGRSLFRELQRFLPQQPSNADSRSSQTRPPTRTEPRVRTAPNRARRPITAAPGQSSRAIQQSRPAPAPTINRSSPSLRSMQGARSAPSLQQSRQRPLGNASRNSVGRSVRKTLPNRAARKIRQKKDD